MKDLMNNTSTMPARESVAINYENPFPEIPDSKWNDMLVEEEFDLFILEIREEILKRCEEIWYEHYMDRQAVSFTIHCAYLAWVKVINIYYMPRDQGDEEERSVKKSWEPDDEPEPAKVDSWATEFLTISKDPPKVQEHEIQDVSTLLSPSSRSETVNIVPSVYCPESSQFGEDEYSYVGDFPGETFEIFVPKKGSIFTRTLTMSREQLPLFEPLNLGLGRCRDEAVSPRKKAAENLIQPAFIDVANVPTNRGLSLVKEVFHDLLLSTGYTTWRNKKQVRKDDHFETVPGVLITAEEGAPSVNDGSTP